LKTLNHKNVRRILIRSTNWIGDAVMTTPAMGAVRATFPDAEITVVANPMVAELFRFHPDCDDVIVFDKKRKDSGLLGFLSFAAELRRGQYDLAILFQNAVEAALMTFFARIPQRVGYRTDGRGVLLTHGVPVGAAERSLHHTSYYLHMLESIGIKGGEGRLRLACTLEELSWADGLLSGNKWAAINPGAAYGSAKRWYPERFAAVADTIAREFGLRILLTGGPGETEIGADIEKAMSEPCLNMVGKTTVRQMSALLSHCALMVTNDSGPMHVAAAFDVPIVAVFGSTDHTTTSPLNDICRIVRHDFDCAPCLLRQCPTDHRCMNAVTVDDVLAAARDLLGGNR